MKIKYSKHVYGDKVTIQLEDKKVILKADEELEVSEDEGKGLVAVEAFTVVKDKVKGKDADPEPKESSKEDKGD